MKYPFPQPYPTFRVCPMCGRRMRLVNFRRWEVATNKSMLHEVCNDCDPTPNLSEMTPDQRQRALRAGVANPSMVERMNEAHQVRRSQVASLRTTQRHWGARTRAWQAAILTQLGKELAWARDNLRSTERTHKALAKLKPQDADYNPDALGRMATWMDFFDAYANVLNDLRCRCKARLSVRQRSKVSPIQPAPRDVDPMTYIYPETIASLRHRYAGCKPLPKRRLFRDPWFLEWGRPQPKQYAQRMPEEEPGADEYED